MARSVLSMARPSKKKPQQKKKDSKGIYVVIGVVVVGLAALVWWSLPGDASRTAHDDAGEIETADGEATATKTPAGFQRLAMASSELAIITDKPMDAVRKLATPEAVAKLLDVKQCGATCDALKKSMLDEDRLEIDVMTAEEYILPPQETMDTTAPGLTPKERASIPQKTTAVVVRTQGPTGVEHVPARTAFAATSALADALDGFVFDQTERIIETKQDFAKRAITTALGQPAFRPRHIIIQNYRQEDGTGRLLTLGMVRFGSPDLIIRGANMGTSDKLQLILDAVAAQIASGKGAPFTITLEDVARLVDKKAADVLNDPSATSHPVTLEAFDAERVEADPDNEIVELAPRGGAAREAWEDVVEKLFGAALTVDVPFDKELEAVAERARRDMPGVIKRFEQGEGALFVKGAFVIPPDNRKDGGPSTEWLWISVRSCDRESRCTGTPSGEPAYATNIGPGKTTSVARKDVVDWQLQKRDGTTAGGESIEILKKRRKK